jgi:hypothetical protein
MSVQRQLRPKSPRIKYCPHCAVAGSLDQPVEDQHDADCEWLAEWRAAKAKEAS